MTPFTRILIPFSKTNNFDKLIVDYINDDDFLKEFYPYEDSLSGIKERITSYNNPRLNRKNLSDVLLKQYNSYGITEIPEKVNKNILSLLNSNTFTITTGHQLNIFSGPLYVIYKLISTINLAEKLNSQFPENHFVPVYWMATEDHDIKEITSLNLYGKNFRWDNGWMGSAGKMPLNGIETIINELKPVFGNSAYANELYSLMSSSYLNSQTLAEATRKWVNKLLGNSGLVILDGNDALLKKSFQDILIDEVINKRSSLLINKTTERLEKKYYSQAKPRDINLFYLGDTFRERIVSEMETLKVLNKDISFSKDEIKAEINSHPEKFSPNVVLRPLYQESILPNIVFIGGPSEISYWLELKELFEFYNAPMPSLFLRSSAMILDKNMMNKLNKLSIKKSDIFLSADEIIKTFINSKSKDQSSFHRAITLISEEFSKLGSSVSQIDPTLVPAVEAENLKVISSLQTLEDKVMRSLKKKNEIEVNQIRKVKEKLFPGGKLQEREESFLGYYLQWGSAFIDMLKDNFDPLDKEFIILEES